MCAPNAKRMKGKKSRLDTGYWLSDTDTYIAEYKQQRTTVPFAILHSIPMVFCCTILPTIIRGIGSNIRCVMCTASLSRPLSHSHIHTYTLYRFYSAWSSRLVPTNDVMRWEMRSSNREPFFLLNLFLCEQTKYIGAALFNSFELFLRYVFLFRFPLYA